MYVCRIVDVSIQLCVYMCTVHVCVCRQPACVCICTVQSVCVYRSTRHLFVYSLSTFSRLFISQSILLLPRLFFPSLFSSFQFIPFSSSLFPCPLKFLHLHPYLLSLSIVLLPLSSSSTSPSLSVTSSDLSIHSSFLLRVFHFSQPDLPSLPLFSSTSV